MGFSANLFATPVDRNLLCAICYGVFENPVVTPCGHTFCKECLESWLRRAADHCDGTTPCPECRRIVKCGDTVSVLALSGLIESLAVECPNAAAGNGCTMVLALGKMRSHLKNCAFTPVKCCGCDNMVRYRDLADHQRRCTVLLSRLNQTRAAALTFENVHPRTEIAALQNELISVKKSLKMSEQTVRRLRHALRDLRSSDSRQYELDFDLAWDSDYSYGYSPLSVSKLARLLSRFLFSKPRHIDRDCVFVCVKRCYDYHRGAAYWQDVLMVLATAFASSWFSDSQKQKIDLWLQNIAQERIVRVS